MPMQTKSWVSELLFDCIYSRYLFALVLEELFKVQYNVRCAKCCKKPLQLINLDGFLFGT